MRRLGIILGVVLGLTLASLAPQAAEASIMSGQNNQIHINSGKTVDDDLYAASRDVLIEGTVNGDVYAAGSTVTVRGTVNGDILSAGSDVLIGGTVKGSVRAAGSTVRLTGAQVGGSVSGFGSSVTIERDSSVGGGLNFAASSAAIRGPVTRGIVGGGGSLVIANTVGKNVDVSANNVTLESSANIAGHLYNYGQGNIQRDSGSQVAGEVKQISTQQQPKPEKRGASVFGILWSIISTFLVGAVLLWLLPRAVTGVANTIQRHPGGSLGFGALAFLLIIPICVVLLITIIGIPLAILAALAFGVALYLAKIFVSLSVGRLIAARTDWTPNPYADFFIGLILLTVLELIPYIGWLVRLIIVLLGVGGLILSFSRRNGRGKALTEERPLAAA
jgi:hypothetical protein